MLELAPRAICADKPAKEGLAGFWLEAFIALAVHKFISAVGELALDAIPAETVGLELLAQLRFVFSRV